MIINYKYKVYPYSEKVTKRSRILAILTSWPMYIVFGIIWFGILNAVLSMFLTEGKAGGIAFVSLVFMVLLIKFIKRQ